jgi:hypothetical protein
MYRAQTAEVYYKGKPVVPLEILQLARKHEASGFTTKGTFVSKKANHSVYATQVYWNVMIWNDEIKEHFKDDCERLDCFIKVKYIKEKPPEQDE